MFWVTVFVRSCDCVGSSGHEYHNVDMWYVVTMHVGIPHYKVTLLLLNIIAFPSSQLSQLVCLSELISLVETMCCSSFVYTVGLSKWLNFNIIMHS